MKKWFLLCGVCGLAILLMGQNYIGVNPVDNGSRIRVTQSSDTILTGMLTSNSGAGASLNLINSGTAVQLSSSTICIGGVYITAMTANSAPAYIGVSTIKSGTGYPLDAGKQVYVPVSTIAQIYVITTTAGTGTNFCNVGYITAY